MISSLLGKPSASGGYTTYDLCCVWHGDVHASVSPPCCRDRIHLAIARFPSIRSWTHVLDDGGQVLRRAGDDHGEEHRQRQVTRELEGLVERVATVSIRALTSRSATLATYLQPTTCHAAMRRWRKNTRPQRLAVTCAFAPRCRCRQCTNWEEMNHAKSHGVRVRCSAQWWIHDSSRDDSTSLFETWHVEGNACTMQRRCMSVEIMVVRPWHDVFMHRLKPSTHDQANNNRYEPSNVPSRPFSTILWACCRKMRGWMEQHDGCLTTFHGEESCMHAFIPRNGPSPCIAHLPTP